MEAMVREMFEAGMTSEQIAAKFTSVMNKMNAEAAKLEERAVYLMKLRDELGENIEEGILDFADAINLIVLHMATKHPDWDKDALEVFAGAVIDTIKTTEEMTDCIISGTDPLTKLLDMLRGRAEKLDKEERETISEMGLDLDTQKITNFLKSMGLA